jgi:transcriptional regulator with XRE-family HTH domain
VRAARVDRGLSQRDLAEQAEIADKYLSRIEVGAATPSVLVAFRIARAMGVRVDDLLVGEPAAPKDAEWRGIMRTLRRLQRKGELERAATILSALVR